MLHGYVLSWKQAHDYKYYNYYIIVPQVIYIFNVGTWFVTCFYMFFLLITLQDIKYSFCIYIIVMSDHLCSLVVRVPGYRSRAHGFDSRCYRIFWEVVGLELGPLSLVSTTEELLGRKSVCSDLECREYGHGDPSRWPRGTLYLQKLVLTSPTSGGRSVGIVLLQTQGMEFVVFWLLLLNDPLVWLWIKFQTPTVRCAME
jgi:hypothetical protein